MIPLLAVVLLLGCSKKPVIAPLPAAVAGTNYFPLVNGTIIGFDGGTGIGDGPIDMEKQSYKVEVAKMVDGSFGFSIDREGRGILNPITMMYAKKPEGIVTYSGMFGAGKTQFSPPFVELPASIGPGAKWSWAGTSSGREMGISSEVEGLETLKVPAGTFKCLKIKRTFSPGGGILQQWYAENKGIIRVVMQNPGGRIQLERSK